MGVYAIGDLHLPGMSENKSMSRFGSEWNNHFLKISEDWQSRVSDDDIVIIAGDISWAMKLDDALEDLNSISELPGRKIMIRGNHDYWWGSATKVRNIIKNNIYILQNDSVELDDFIFGGTRGWNLVNSPDLKDNPKFDTNDVKIYQRELLRLRLSLEAFKTSNKIKIGIMHFPPVFSNMKDTDFSSIFTEYGAQYVVYGHLHADSIKLAFNGLHDGVDYSLVSADALNFKLKRII